VEGKMAEEPMNNPPATLERLPIQINEINEKLKLIENLITDLSPSVEKIPEEIPPIRDLRKKIEKDETFKLLVHKIGDNIPTFLTLLDTMEAVKGMIEDFAPSIGKISKEIMPTLNMLRETFERDETLKLVNKVGENIPTFLTLLDLMEAVKGMIEDFAPAVGKISKEMMPTINILRESLEKDEVLELIQKTGENINTFNKLLDFINKFDKSGILDFTLENVLAKETNFMLKGIQNSAARTMQQIMEEPIKPGFKNIFSAIRDPEVQKGILMMTVFAKNMSQCMTETIEESRRIMMSTLSQ
jgi:uncharacterized protein YjgD (DUF1641 family)